MSELIDQRRAHQRVLIRRVLQIFPRVVIVSILLLVLVDLFLWANADRILALIGPAPSPSSASIRTALWQISQSTFSDREPLELTLSWLRELPGMLVLGAILFGYLLWYRLRVGYWLGSKYGAHECQFCGYDLRGTSGATCPECGKAIYGRA